MPLSMHSSALADDVTTPKSTVQTPASKQHHTADGTPAVTKNKHESSVSSRATTSADVKADDNAMSNTPTSLPLLEPKPSVDTSAKTLSSPSSEATLEPAAINESETEAGLDTGDEAGEPATNVVEQDEPEARRTTNERNESGKQHILRAGDTVMMRVFGHADMTSEMVIAEDGFITVPLLGALEAEGKSVHALKQEIRQLLDRDFIVEPRVTLEVIGYEPFFILGQVMNPGSYEYEPGMDIRKAVALAGGFTSRARTSNMTIIRKEAGERMQVEGNMDAPIFPGDTIEIRRRWF